MKTNLSSQISLHRVSPRYYRPENAFEKSVLTRLEKIPTDIYESVEEGANYIAREIAQTIREKQKAGRFCVLALPGGDSPSHVYTELIRMHKEEGLSFRNVIVFNMYEYYPLAPDAINSNFNALKSMLLDHIDIDKQNIFTPDGSIAKDTIFEYCRLYEQRIESFGGIDIALLGIGRVGNIAFNELLDYKQMLRPDTVKYFLFTIARNIVIDYIRRYYKKQEIDSYIYDTMSTSTNETEEKIIGDDLMTMERTRLAAMPEQRRLIYTLNRFENKTSPEIANELNLSCRTVENHLFLGRREMREFFRNCI